jgi:hypothetical protein
MSSFTFSEKLFACSVSVAVLSVLTTAPIAQTAAQQAPAPPDFSSKNVGWVGLNGNGPFFEAVPGKLPGPMTQDPRYPFVPNGVGGQPSYRIADLSNPNLKPWVKERMKKDNDEVLGGKIAFTAGSSCMPLGVPGFMSQGGPNSLYFVQTPSQVRMISQSNQQVRRVAMNVPHSANPKPSWYGESVGHYEGDSLVIDTIGLSEKLPLDVYRTPHTEKVRVVERWRIIDDGKMMEATFRVEDPEAFYEPWWGMRRYRRVERQDIENRCAEGNFNLFDYKIPVAHKPDF